MATLEFYFLIMWQLVPIFPLKDPLQLGRPPFFFCGTVAKIQPHMKEKKTWRL